MIGNHRCRGCQRLPIGKHEVALAPDQRVVCGECATATNLSRTDPHGGSFLLALANALRARRPKSITWNYFMHALATIINPNVAAFEHRRVRVAPHLTLDIEP